MNWKVRGMFFNIRRKKNTDICVELHGVKGSLKEKYKYRHLKSIEVFPNLCCQLWCWINMHLLYNEWPIIAKVFLSLSTNWIVMVLIQNLSSLLQQVHIVILTLNQSRGEPSLSLQTSRLGADPRHVLADQTQRRPAAAHQAQRRQIGHR